jgi:hypothetical protein
MVPSALCCCCCCCCCAQDENKFLVQNLVEIKMELAETQSEWGGLCSRAWEHG